MLKFFSVSIDALVSSEQVISIAEKENKSNIRYLCNLLFGIADLLSFMLILLPLYPNTVDGFVYSVNLLSYRELAPANHLIYWTLFILLIAVGLAKVLMTKGNTEKGNKVTTGLSMVINVLTVLFLAITREAYAVVVAFVILGIKVTLLFLSFVK